MNSDVATLFPEYVKKKSWNEKGNPFYFFLNNSGLGRLAVEAKKITTH